MKMINGLNGQLVQKGFSLVELMIVVAIVGILASVAIPSYVSYIQRGRIAEATSELSSRRAQMEQYYQDARTYTGAPACVAGVAGEFNVTCEVPANGESYVLTATGRDSMADFTYTLNEVNTMNSDTPSDWGGDDAGCWVIKKGGC